MIFLKRTIEDIKSDVQIGRSLVRDIPLIFIWEVPKVQMWESLLKLKFCSTN